MPKTSNLWAYEQSRIAKQRIKHDTGLPFGTKPHVPIYHWALGVEDLPSILHCKHISLSTILWIEQQAISISYYQQLSQSWHSYISLNNRWFSLQARGPMGCQLSNPHKMDCPFPTGISCYLNSKVWAWGSSTIVQEHSPGHFRSQKLLSLIK